MMVRRSYGTGALFERTDSAGRVTWYGKWRDNGTQVKRRIGPKRVEGSREGLTRRAAEAELRRLIGEVKPVVPATEAPTIDEVGRRYMTYLERMGRKLSTRMAVETTLRVYLEPFFGERTINSVTHDDAVDLMSLMERKGIAPKTIRNHMGTLAAIFNFAKGPRRKWATSNPCEGLELPAVPEHDGFRYLELDQLDALVSNAQSGPYQTLDRVMYRTAAMTGLRLGEMIALRWRDVDWHASAIRVRSNYVCGEFGTPKSKRSTRSVPMADEVAGALTGYYKQRSQPRADELVFSSPKDGGPLDKSSVIRRLRRALAAAGLDTSHRFHDLRHTFGTDYAPRTRDAELVAAAFTRPAASAQVSDQYLPADV